MRLLKAAHGSPSNATWTAYAASLTGNVTLTEVERVVDPPWTSDDPTFGRDQMARDAPANVLQYAASSSRPSVAVMSGSVTHAGTT
jgi:hypothetical protein